MKKSLFLCLIMLSLIYSTNAQKTVNINSVSHRNYQEIDISKNSNLEFREAKRLRKIVFNEYVQTNKQIRLHDTIELDLFKNKQYKAYVNKVDVDVNGTLIVSAKLVGYESAHCFISTFEGKTMISVNIPENNEQFRSKYNQVTKANYLLEIDKTKLLILEGSSETGNNEENGIQDDNPPIKKSSRKVIIPNNNKPSIKESIENKTVISDSIALNRPSTLDTIKLLVVCTTEMANWYSKNKISITSSLKLMMINNGLLNNNGYTILDIELINFQNLTYIESQIDRNHNEISEDKMNNIYSLQSMYCTDLVTLLRLNGHRGAQVYLLTGSKMIPTNNFSILKVRQVKN